MNQSLLFLSLLLALTTVTVKGCVFQTSEGRIIDLNRLTNRGPNGGDFRVNYLSYQFYFNPCSVTNYYKSSTSPDKDCSASSICQKTELWEYALGDPLSAIWSESVDHIKSLPSMTLTSVASDFTRVSTINIICGTSDVPELSYGGEKRESNNVIGYTFNFNINCDALFPPLVSRCNYTSSDNINYNLAKLTNQGPFRGDFRARHERFDYIFNPCADNTNYVLESPIERRACAGNSLCQSLTSGEGEFPIGILRTAIWREESRVPILTLYGGEPGVCTVNGRTSEIRFNCDYNSISPTFSFVNASYSNCFYQFRMDLNCSRYFNAPLRSSASNVCITFSVAIMLISLLI